VHLSPKLRWALIALAAVAVAVAAYLLLRGRSEEPEEKGPRETPVVTAPAEAARVQRTVRGVGDVRATESVTLTAEAPGRVEAILFREGARVGRGAILVRLRAAQERADVSAAQAEAAEIAGRLARLERLAAEGAAARGEVEDLRRQLQAARARTASAATRIDDYTIRAPFAGVIGLRDISVGAVVQSGDAIATLDAIDQVDVRFAVPERELGRLRVGAAVEARSTAFDRPFTGRLRLIDSRVDPANRTVRAEARMANPGRQLRPGMLAEITIAAEAAQSVVVPPVAVQVQGGEQFVYVSANGKAKRTPVEVGQREPGRLEILRGLKPGDRVIVEGLQQVNDGGPVREAQPGRRPEGGRGKPE
jgi:membrane fusion protein (multidrug efflux system)